MDKLFDSYWVLRVTAMVLAILMFVYVKASMTDGQDNITSNDMDILKDIPLEVYYDAENFIVTGLPKTVDVTIEGPTQLVLQAKLDKDFKVFVDLNSLLMGEHTVKIQHENFSEKLDVSIEPEKVDITIEEKITKEMRVDPEINNRLVAEGYELEDMTAEPKNVLITGAKSVMESISYVKATVASEEGIIASFEQEANVKVLDSNLNKLEVLIEPEIVNVKVDVHEYSVDLPVAIQQIGVPQQGVTINKLTTETENVKVFGPKSFVDSLNEIVVKFDISEIENSGTYEMDLAVPNGATKLSSKKIEIQADVTRDVIETEEPPATEETSDEESSETSSEEQVTEEQSDTSE